MTELSHVVQVRAEGPKAPSPGQRPGYVGNQQGALKGQKLLAQGNALGIMIYKPTPCKGKSFKNSKVNIRLLPLQGALLIAFIPRALPWARSFCPFRACGDMMVF